MAQKKKVVGSAESGGGAEATVDQIREIIFGGNIREYDSRFKAIQEDLSSSFKKLRSELNAGIKGLEGAVGETREALEKEADARRNAEESLDALVQHKCAELGKEIDAAEQRLSHGLAKLTKDSQATDKRLEAKLDKTAERLGERQVARNELAALLEGLARKLKGTSDRSQ